MEEFLWSEKYRPKTIDEVILPDALRKPFKQFIKQKNVPNLILSGTSGIGKTTSARVMLEQIGSSYIKINASMYGNIDTLRNDMLDFATTGSFDGKRKYILLDEADYLNPTSTQPALRSFMDEFSTNCGFIFTCNYKNKITEHIQSRCKVFDFNLNKKEMLKLVLPFYERLIEILDKEGVTYDKAVIAEVIKTYFPDWRRILNELQAYSSNSDHKIDSGIISLFTNGSVDELVSLLKEKNFTSIRKWVGENLNSDCHSILRRLYDISNSMMKDNSVPQLVLIIAKYLYQDAFVSDHEINLMACLTEIMVECEFK